MSAVTSATQQGCVHCSTLFTPRFEGETFCCSGCRVVHDLIQSSGLGTFYELLGRTALDPADQNRLSDETRRRLETAITEAAKARPDPDRPAKLTLRVANISCTACVWLVEQLHRQQSGNLKLRTDTARSTVTLWWIPGDFDPMRFLTELHRFGYPGNPIDGTDESNLPSESEALLTRLAVTGGLAMNTMAFTLPMYLGLETETDLARLFTLVAFASASLAVLVGGSYFFQRAITAIQLRTLHMDLPIALGLAAAYLGSVVGVVFSWESLRYYDFVAMFAFFMLGGRWLHIKTIERNRRELLAREKELIAVTQVDEAGKKTNISLSKIVVDQTLEIADGAILPVGGKLISDTVPLLLDWINGEPDPMRYERGSEVPAGARNDSGAPVTILSREAFAGSLLERLLRRDEDDPDEKGITPADRVLKPYLLSVLIVAFFGAAGWILLAGAPATALQVFVSVLVVSCPCALGLALPLLDEIVHSSLKRRGIFVRNRGIWSRLSGIRILAFDKTGTLTEPQKRLQNPEILESLTAPQINALRDLTASNRHPVARSLHEIIQSRFGDSATVATTPLDEVPGNGVSTGNWRLGRDRWACFAESQHDFTGCSLSENGRRVAHFQIKEALRDGVISQFQTLRQSGYRLAILSGDPNRAQLGRIAKQLDLTEPESQSDLSPQDKADWIDSQDDAVLYIGDGGNDSLAFRAATVSGTPATGIREIEAQADFVYTGRGFHALHEILSAASCRRHRSRLIFILAITYNTAAVAVSLAGWMNPLLAAILMPISSIVTVFVAARGRKRHYESRKRPLFRKICAAAGPSQDDQ